MRRLIFILLVLIVLAPLVGPRDALALSVSPLVYTYEVKPGDQVADTITLRNETAEPVTYTPSVQDFVGSDDETGTPKFVASGTAVETSLAEWISFSTSSINLAPSEQRHVSFTVSVPSDAKAGGYYGGLLFSGGTGINQKIGVLLLVAVEGDVTKSAELVSFDGTAELVSHLPMTLTTRIKNSGDVFLQPYGFIQINNMLGGESATLGFNQDAGNILPSGTRRFTTTWQNEEVPDDIPEIIKEWKNFGFGRYTANLVVQYGPADAIINASTTFWVVPWQLIIAAAIIILVLFAITRHKRQQK